MKKAKTKITVIILATIALTAFACSAFAETNYPSTDYGNATLITPKDNLIAKYNWLKSSDRDEIMGALSPTNRRTLILAPGRYVVDSTGLVLDTSYVDITTLTLSSPDSVRIYHDNPYANMRVIKQTAYDVRLSGFSVEACGESFEDNYALELKCSKDYTGCKISGATRTIRKTGIGTGGIQVEDVVCIPSGNNRGCYPIIEITDSDNIVVSGKLVSENNASLGIVSMHSCYRYLKFYSSYSIAVYGTSHFGGCWENCVSNWSSWISAANKMQYVKMYNCEGKLVCFGGETPGCYLDGFLFGCKGEEQSFGGCSNRGGDVNAELWFCEAGDGSYALGRTFSGKAYYCKGGAHCFAGFSGTKPYYYGTFSGYAEGCTATGNSFGGGNANCVNSGTLVNCRVTGMDDAMYCTGAKIRNSFIKTDGTNKHAIVLNDNNTEIHNSTLIANGSGNSIYAEDYKSVLALYCSMNADKSSNVINAVGDGTLEAGFCIISANIK